MICKGFFIENVENAPKNKYFLFDNSYIWN